MSTEQNNDDKIIPFELTPFEQGIIDTLRLIKQARTSDDAYAKGIRDLFEMGGLEINRLR